MSAETVPFHPLADCFPLIEGAELDELVASIEANGLREPIVMLDGAILDGRNRYRACLAAGIAPRFENFVGADPYAFVVDKNLHRRHLNASQRAMIAAKLANMRSGKRTDLEPPLNLEEVSIDKAADLLNVSPASVFNAKTIQREGTPEEIREVEAGRAAVSTVAHNIRANRPADAKRPQTDGERNRIERQRLNAQIWGQLRDALLSLTGLPRPADVAAIARAHDRAGMVDARLARSLQWLKEFDDVWSKRDQAA